MALEYTRRLETDIAGGLPVHASPQLAIMLQAIKKSHQAHIQEMYPKDVEKRFRDRNHAHDWLTQKDRFTYALTDKSGRDLGGWASVSRRGFLPHFKHLRNQLPDPAQVPIHRIGFRLYDGYRDEEAGEPMARPFVQTVLRDLFTQPAMIHTYRGLWLRLRPENEEAHNVYRELGFVALEDDSPKVTMVLSRGPQSLRALYTGD